MKEKSLQIYHKFLHFKYKKNMKKKLLNLNKKDGNRSWHTDINWIQRIHKIQIVCYKEINEIYRMEAHKKVEIRWLIFWNELKTPHSYYR